MKRTRAVAKAPSPSLVVPGKSCSGRGAKGAACFGAQSFVFVGVHLLPYGKTSGDPNLAHFHLAVPNQRLRLEREVPLQLATNRRPRFPKGFGPNVTHTLNADDGFIT